MSDWKQTIEAQIAELHDLGLHKYATTLQSALDVAVAAHEVNEAFYSHHPNYYQVHHTHADTLGTALDKLAEGG